MKDLEEQFNRWVAMKSYQRRLKKSEEGQREWSQEAGRREVGIVPRLPGASPRGAPRLSVEGAVGGTLTSGLLQALNIRIPWHLGCFETDTLCLISLTSGCQLNAVCSAYV